MTAPAPAASGYQHSPRPSYDHGTAILRSQAARHVWGDAESGEILDLVYVSNQRIHELLFEIPAGGQFTHSADFRTIFGADEVLYVVEGCVALADPQTGSVVRVAAGDAVFFGPDTWHHAFNFSAPARPGSWSSSRRRRPPARQAPTPSSSPCCRSAGTPTTRSWARSSPARPGWRSGGG
jgi:hypothetical protein